MIKKMIPFLFMLGCSGCNDTSVDDEIVVEDNPITWTECGYEFGDHPCDFTLTDQNGDPWSLYDNYGSIMVLDFSTEWCYYCQVAAADAQQIQDAYADRDVIYVTIMIEDHQGNSPSQDMIDRWVSNFGITAPVLAGSRDLISEGWDISGWPTFFFITRDMKIRTGMRGYSDETMITILDMMLVEEMQEEAAE
jgi:thiol-disulfide isomerase/thioredoxin